MLVVWHNAEREDSHGVFLSCFFKKIQESFVIFFLKIFSLPFARLRTW